jgi:hypothetical protein
MIAARVAAELNRESDVEAKIVRGRIGELSVVVDGEEVVKTNPFWYPLPGQVVEKVKRGFQDK